MLSGIIGGKFFAFGILFWDVCVFLLSFARVFVGRLNFIVFGV